MKWKRWDMDRWGSRHGSLIPWDKLEHLIRETILTAGLLLAFGGTSWVYLPVVAFGLLYEVYNGIVPYDGYAVEGFSFKDELANLGGIALGTLIYHLTFGGFP